MLHKRDCIISAVKQRNANDLKHKHKFDIEVTKTFADSIALDKNNDDTLWQEAITK